MAWTHRLWNLLRGRALDRELDEELRFHVDARTRDNIHAGMHPEPARQDALRRFGSATLAKELTRETDLLASLDSLGRDLRDALRTLRRSPGFTAVAILVMALGIGANTAVFTIVNSVLLRSLPFPQSDRLFLVSCEPKRTALFFGRGFFGPSMADAHYLEFRRRDQQFESLATLALNPVTLTRAGDPVRLTGALVTPDFLRVLRVDPTLGRGFLREDGDPSHPPVVLLGDPLWRSRFAADPAVVGRTIRLDGVGHTVIGVMPPGFSFPPGMDLWIPFEVRLQTGNSFSRPVIGRLKNSVSPRQAQAALEAFAAALPADRRARPNQFEARLEPLQDVMVSGIRRSLLVFSGAVAFVLLIACANLANLLLMRAASRRHEIAVRAALGASRERLLRQLLTESLLVALAGGLAGVLLAVLSVPGILALAPPGKIPRAAEIAIDVRVLLFTIGLAAITGSVFGLAPALRTVRGGLRQPLVDAGRTSTGRKERLRTALVVSEIALALVLLAGAGLLLKSFWRIQSIDPGFRSANVVAATVDLPDSRYRTPPQMQAFHQRTLEKLSSLPGVQAAGAVNWMPLGSNLVRGDFQIEGGRRLPPRFLVDKPVVSPGYFQAMGIRLLSGRPFSERDTASSPGVAIISRSVAQVLWPGEEPLGKRIAMPDHPKPEDWLAIIGVVDDIRQTQLTAQPSPAVYLPYFQVTHPFFLGHMTFIVRTASNPAAIASAIRGVIQGVDPDQPVQSIATMSQVIAGTTSEPRFRARVVAAFSLLAVLLSAIGIYGVLACSIVERTREIGIRMALGAGNTTILAMVLGRTLRLACAGVALGTVGALALTRVLKTFLFEVQPTDPVTFAVVAGFLLLVALLAGLLPAQRASAVDPLVALRHE